MMMLQMTSLGPFSSLSKCWQASTGMMGCFLEDIVLWTPLRDSFTLRGDGGARQNSLKAISHEEITLHDTQLCSSWNRELSTFSYLKKKIALFYRSFHWVKSMVDCGLGKALVIHTIWKLKLVYFSSGVSIFSPGKRHSHIELSGGAKKTNVVPNSYKAFWKSGKGGLGDLLSTMAPLFFNQQNNPGPGAKSWIIAHLS